MAERERKRPSSGNEGLLGVICLLRGLKNWFHLLERRREVRRRERVRERGRGEAQRESENDRNRDRLTERENLIKTIHL